MYFSFLAVGACIIISCMQNFADAKSIDPRCDSKALSFGDYPSVQLDYFNRLTELPLDTENEMSFLFAKDNGGFRIKKRPLLGLIRKRSDAETMNVILERSLYQEACSKEKLAIQLQTAMELEWATIPTYLNGYYSIKSGHNTDISSTIRGIVIQEMKHMNLAANMLIAMNVEPVINSFISAPHYPTTGLPGLVLPNLTINMEKLSIDYLFKVYMGIEVPLKTEVGGDYGCKGCFTIGAFYHEISDCIDRLDHSGEDIFDPATKSKQPIHFDITPILNASDALNAIGIIVREGEGTGLLDPYQTTHGDALAHFYEFEQMVCGRKLVNHDNVVYSYTGEKIPFDEDGVYPIKKNIELSDLPPSSPCYEKARQFHDQYRDVLSTLQEAFTVNPKKRVGKVMKDLSNIAKDLVKIKIDHNTNCPPVWAFDWPLN